MTNKQILLRVKEAIRRPYAWPGGYPLYVLLSDGELLCTNCAKENYRDIAYATKYNHPFSSWRAAGVMVLWEGEAIICSHCAKELESAYGPIEESTDETTTKEET
jgi:hypothetical protein